MSKPTHATVVVTVALGNASTDDIEQFIRKALRDLKDGFGTKVVGCDWVPDMDTVADCAGVNYYDIDLIDLNPHTHSLTEA